MVRYVGFFIITAALNVGACSWVKPSVASQKVALATTAEVANCRKKGVTTSKTVAKMWFIPRSSDKIFTELVTLAKNEAVIFGGDTVVPVTELVNGERNFEIYDCRQSM